MSLASDRLQLYLDAEIKVLSGQRVRVESGGVMRDLSRADLKEIREGIKYWTQAVNAENANGTKRKSPFSAALADFSNPFLNSIR